MDGLDKSESHGLAGELRGVFVSRRDPAAVPDYQVVAVTSGNSIAGGTADNDIVTTTRVDVIDSADAVITAEDPVNVRWIAIGYYVIDVTVVAQYDVVAASGRNCIAGFSAKDNV